MLCYKTDLGEAYYGDSLKLIDTLEDNSIDLVMTSPPFGLLREKDYGNVSQEQYVDWLCQFGEKIFPKLKDSGSFVMDLGGAFTKGEPSYNLYQFRVLIKFCDDIGYKLAQPFYWFNTSALPAPIEWVNKKKIRAKSAVNTVWWFIKNADCKADVTKVLTPYSDRMKQLLKTPDNFFKEGAERPSGHTHTASWVKDNGGAIPSNLLQISNSESNSQYLRACKAAGLKAHSARYPAKLVEFFINFLTDEGDTVLDIFGGSNTTGAVCEQLGRKWKCFEIKKEYVAQSSFRFIKNIERAKEVYNYIMNLNGSDNVPKF